MTEAWDLADAAASRAGARISAVETLRQMDLVDDVIRRVWGGQVIGHEALRAFQHAGCVLLGAWDPWDEGTMLGFAFGFVGFADGLHLHSHMLAVVPEAQTRGVGFALKLGQRADCLDHGITDVRWTFDPLIARNGWFNLMKLGAVGTAFLPDFYGAMQDELNRGDRSDRFEVTWDLTSERVTRASAIPHGDRPAVDLTDATPLLETADPEALIPSATGRPPGRRAWVPVPMDHLGLRRRDPALAARWRDETAKAFTACFDGGLMATAVTRDGRYLFEPGDRPAGGAGDG